MIHDRAVVATYYGDTIVDCFDAVGHSGLEALLVDPSASPARQPIVSISFGGS